MHFLSPLPLPVPARSWQQVNYLLRSRTYAGLDTDVWIPAATVITVGAILVSTSTLKLWQALVLDLSF